MDKCREEFEEAFPIPTHWIEFNEKSNEYYCPYVADAKAFEYQSQWVVWQYQQERIDYLNKCHNSRVAELVRLNQVKVDRLVDLQKRVDDLEQAIQHCFEVDEVMRMKFEKIYKETDGNYLHVLDRYDTETDSYPNNDYVQMRYKWFRAGSKSRQSEIDELQKEYDDLNARASQIAWDQMTTAKLNYELETKLNAVKLLLPSLKAENDLWGCEQVQKQLELLEQAMK